MKQKIRKGGWEFVANEMHEKGFAIISKGSMAYAIRGSRLPWSKASGVLNNRGEMHE